MNSSLFSCAPTDILLLIFKASTQPDLVRLSLVNKPFHTLLQPQIYHTISFVWNHHSTPSVVPLLRTILARPDLAPYIRVVKLSGETFHLPPFRMKLPPKIPISENEREQMVEVVKSLGVHSDFCALWIARLRGEASPTSRDVRSLGVGWATMDAVLALLLSKLPNLTSLHLGPSFTKETTVLGGMLKHALCENISGLSKFEMLKEVYFSPRICIEQQWGRNGNDKKPDNSLCPLTFFYAPAVEHITATIEEPETFRWPGSPPSTSTLTSLDITLLREGTLGNILSHCENLHALAYHWYADKGSAQSHDSVQRALTPVLVGDRLMASLSLVENRLKSLVLTAYITEHDYDGHEAEPESIDIPISLRGWFSKLENLEIPIVFLLGYEPSDKIKLGNVLPANVQSVTVTDDAWWKWATGWGDRGETLLLDVFQEWFGNWRENTPRLEKMRLLVGEMDPWSPEGVQRLKNTGANVGLEVEYKKAYKGLDRFWPRVVWM